MGIRDEKRSPSTVGFLYGVAAYTLWGFLPLYWKMLDRIPAMEILAHRISWSFVFVMGILVFQGKLGEYRLVFQNRSNLVRILWATSLITVNWGLYIWSITSGHVVEASMGYYMNPLIVVLLGVIVLKEKLNRWQVVSLVLAALGVAIITIQHGRMPWIALILAVSFALYGLMKKMIPVGSTTGLAVETTLLMPLTLTYIFLKQINGIGALGKLSLGTTLILIGSGVATALPLLWFAKGARRVPLSTMGFLQYIAPSISLMLGIFVFKEQFTTVHLLSFGSIWSGLLIYSISQVRQMRRVQVSTSTIAEK